MSFKIPVVGTGVSHQTVDHKGTVVDTVPAGGEQQAPETTGYPRQFERPQQASQPQPYQHQGRYQRQIARGDQSLNNVQLHGSDPAAATTDDAASTPNSFHPDLDPTKFDFSFDRFGRLQKTAKAAPVETAEAGAVEEAPAETPDPAQAVAAANATLAGQTTPGVSDMDALRQHVSQLTQVVLGMAQQSQNAQAVQPAQQAAPDYSNIDMYDPAQVVALAERTADERFKKLMNEQFQPQVNRIDEQNAQSQVNHIVTTYGRDAVTSRAELLLELAKSNPLSNVQQLWDLADRLVGPVATNAQKPAGAIPSQAARTITATQAAEKAEQAKRLPVKGSNSGVNGASIRSGPPERMLKNLALGSIAAWNSLNNGS